MDDDLQYICGSFLQSLCVRVYVCACRCLYLSICVCHSLALSDSVSLPFAPSASPAASRYHLPDCLSLSFCLSFFIHSFFFHSFFLFSFSLSLSLSFSLSLSLCLVLSLSPHNLSRGRTHTHPYTHMHTYTHTHTHSLTISYASSPLSHSPYLTLFLLSRSLLRTISPLSPYPSLLIPLSISLPLALSLSLYLFLPYHSLPPSFPPSLSFSISPSLFLPLSISLSLHVSLSLGCLSLSCSMINCLCPSLGIQTSNAESDRSLYFSPFPTSPDPLIPIPSHPRRHLPLPLCAVNGGSDAGVGGARVIGCKW